MSVERRTALVHKLYNQLLVDLSNTKNLSDRIQNLMFNPDSEVELPNTIMESIEKTMEDYFHGT